MRITRLLMVVAAVGLVGWLGLIWLHADEGIAKEFLAKGDEAMKKGETERALELYQKAVKEAPEMPEAYFKAGEALLKVNDKFRCRIAFKKCLALIDKIDKPAAALIQLKKKAEDILANLDDSRKDGKAIEQEYLKQLLAFAKQAKAKDNNLAEEALNRILVLAPDNAEAQKLLEEVKKNIVFPHWTAIFKNTLEGWNPQEPESWKIESEKVMVCDTEGALRNVNEKVRLEGNFKVSMEFKIGKVYTSSKRPYAIGLMLGIPGDESANSKAVSIMDDNVIKLIKFVEGKGGDLRSNSLPDNYKKDGWNRLQVEVSGKVIRAYINDKPVLDYESDNNDEFKGAIGIWVQSCRVGVTNIKILK